METVILLICVMLLVMAFCILSYLKNIFERIIEREDSSDENDSVQAMFIAVRSELENLRSEFKGADGNIKQQVENLSKEFASLKERILLDDRSHGNVSAVEAEGDAGFSDSDRVSYRDAATAFHKINNELFALRKKRDVLHELLGIIYNGHGDVRPGILDGLPDSEREEIVSALAKIKIFNRNYRPALDRGLRFLGLSFGSNVRYPLDQPFDNSWDENILGYDVEDGNIIKRVVGLGYEFPDSPVIGRQKTKVM